MLSLITVTQHDSRGFNLMKFFFRPLLLLLVCNLPVLAQLDSSFGSSGAFVILNSSRGSITDSIIQADNKVVAGGRCTSINAQTFPACLVRLTQTGAEDSTFGNGLLGAPPGHVFISIPGYNPNLDLGSVSIVIQKDGKIVVLVYASVSGQQKSYLVRYNSNGTLDTGFGDQGFKRLDFFTGFHGNEMQIQPDGKFVIVSGGYIVRYLSDGTIDTGFGENGIFFMNLPDSSFEGTSIELQNDGKLVFSGVRSIIGGSSGFVGRINRNGTIDTSFDADGYKIIDSETGFKALSIQGDQRIVALSLQNTIYRFTTNGALDTSFDSDGSRSVFRSPTVDTANDLAVTPSGKITVVGNQLPINGGVSVNYLIARFTLNGSPDTTFSGGGLFDLNIFNQDNPFSIVFDRDGKTVVGGFSAQGTVLNPYETPRFSIARLVASPTQNVEFSGKVTDQNGRALYLATLTLKDGANIVGYARPNHFGYFRFLNIPSNKTYTVSINVKANTLAEREVLVDGNLLNYSLVAY